MKLESKIESVTVPGPLWVELLTELKFAESRLRASGTKVTSLLYSKVKGERLKDKSRKELREILMHVSWDLTGSANGLRDIGEGRQ